MPYITTSRKAGPVTRRLARSLSNIFPNCVYENRGKRNFDSVIMRACKQLGYSRVILVYESHGNPAEIQAVDIKSDGAWEIVERVRFNVVKVERVLARGVTVDESARGFADMFADEGVEHEEMAIEEKGRRKAKLAINDNYLSVKINGKEAIILKLSNR